MSEIHENDETRNEVQEAGKHGEVTMEKADPELAGELDDQVSRYMDRPGKETEKPEHHNIDKAEKEKDAGEEDETFRNKLTDEDRAYLKKETGWSDEVIDSTKSLEEAEVYKNANLEEREIDGKKCLIRKDLDMEQVDEFGCTNQERMRQGKAPLTRDGGSIELHHIGQKPDSPLAELTMQEHRGKGNDTIMHDKTKESEIDRNQFASERRRHWEARADN